MKCDVVYKKARESEYSENSDGLEQLRGRGFKDEREYLKFLLEQERLWEQTHLNQEDKQEDTK